MISLRQFLSDDLPLLSYWLGQSHVAPWFPEADDFLAWARNPPKAGGQAIISIRSASKGYIRWQLVDRQTLDSLGLYHIPANSADADILIGAQSDCSRGIGRAALLELVRILKARGDVPMLGLTTSVHNTRAHRTFAGAGFVPSGNYTAGSFGDCCLYTANLTVKERDITEYFE